MKTFKTIRPHVQRLNPVTYHGVLDMEPQRCNMHQTTVRVSDGARLSLQCRLAQNHKEPHDFGPIDWTGNLYANDYH